MRPVIYKIDCTYKNELHLCLPCASNALILISEIVDFNDVSDTAYNSAYVSDVQSLITKSILQHFFG